MALRINTNVQSLTAQNQLAKSKEGLENTQAKLATGSRIVNAGDDAAGLAISENLRSDIRATGQNVRNAQSGMFLLQTADGALNECGNILIRMKELAVQGASGTNGDKERFYLDNEYQALKAELDRIAGTTIFNGRPLLNGQGGDVSIQIGPNNVDSMDRVTVASNFTVGTQALGVGSLSVATEKDSQDALDPITNALEHIAQVRGAIGAGESRLGTTMSALNAYEENITKAYSQIRDADFAFETANLAKYNILSQAGVSVLTQANASPQLALKLLG